MTHLNNEWGYSMKELEIIAYKQGGNWIINVDGYLTELHYSVRSKKDVRMYCEWNYPSCKVVFA
jgi:hypothetical protein